MELQRYTSARALASVLTSTVESMLRHGNLEKWQRRVLLEELIAAHELFPIGSSEGWIAQWKEQFPDLFEPVTTLPEDVF